MKRFVMPLVAMLALVMSVSFSSCNNAPAEPVVVDVDSTEIVIENIMARRSIRKYTDQAVPRDVLNKIIECGINAPNGMNKQLYQVKVVDDPESVAFLADTLNGLYKAPVYMFIAASDTYDMSKIDCGLLSENICLSAWAYGIGSINLGMPVRALKENSEVLAKLGFEEHYDLCLVLALGYADEAPAAKPRDASKVQFISVK